MSLKFTTIGTVLSWLARTLYAYCPGCAVCVVGLETRPSVCLVLWVLDAVGA
jgi:Pyruvate/2-oxoacid:ferredoxin oxidoreductase delta subunit